VIGDTADNVPQIGFRIEPQGSLPTFKKMRKGPAVRSDSLLEQRGFELPVLFCGSWLLRKARSFSGFTALKPIRELFSERSCRQILVEKRPTSAPLQRGKRPKRTGGSNPFCSSNEALRTGGPLCGSWRLLRELFSERPTSKFGPKTARLGPLFQGYRRRKRPLSDRRSSPGPESLSLKSAATRAFPEIRGRKEDRRFECPPLQQRGTANRRSRSRDTNGRIGVPSGCTKAQVRG